VNADRRRSIHEALVRLADGDRSGFSTLMAELWPVILAFAQRGLGQRADAEDVAQEVFVRICGRISELDRDRDGLSWAFGIARYEIMTQRKRTQRRREVSGSRATQEADLGPSQEAQLIDRELIAAAEGLVGALSASDREALGLGDDAGPSGPRMRKRKQRALARLRDLWRSAHGG
jgi:RNA polymerase sigma-70 factor, ECF subfamily